MRWWIGGAAGLTALAAAGLWLGYRSVPIEPARRFLAAPIRVGESPPETPAASEGASLAEIERRYAASREAFAAGRYAEAAEGFAWVVSSDPRGPQAGPAQWNLTRSRLRSGDATAAIAGLEDLIHHHADFLGAEAPDLRRGLDLMERNQLAAARSAFERMIRDQPDSELVPLAHALIARIHWHHGEPVETVRAFARMFASVDDAVPAYSSLADQLERYASGEAEVSETFADLARSGEPGFRDVYQYLAARSLLEQDRFEATQDALEELRREYPGGDFSQIVDLEHAWNLLRHGKAAEALAIFERLERESASGDGAFAAPAPAGAAAFDRFFDLRAELPLGIARCYLALGDDAKAVAAFERAGEHAPGRASTYGLENQIGLAMALERLGQLDRAAQVLRDAIEEHPDEPKLWAIRQQLARIEGRIAAR